MEELIGIDVDRYHIISKVGEGGMAVVYKAFDTRLECNVAIKFIRTQKLSGENAAKALKRFKNEAQKTAALSHPNIVPVMDYGEFNGLPYLVMKYINGGTLKKAITYRIKEGQKTVPYHQAAALLLPIAEALDVAHKNNLVHRDVKPSNILLTENGQPMLTDFGVAKITETEETLDQTGMGVGIGTPEYMAPEQWEGVEIDGRADVYALGIVFYELITGRVPYRADTVPAILVKVLRDPLPSPKDYVPDIPDKVEQILIKALAKDAKNRYSDMRAFAIALEKLAGDNSSTLKERNLVETNQTRTSPITVIRKPVPWRWIGISLGTVVLVLLAAVWARSVGLFQVSHMGISEQPTTFPLSGTEETQDSLIIGDVTLQAPANTITPITPEPIATTTGTSLQPSLDEEPVYSENFEDGFAHGFEFGPGNWSVVDDGSGNKVLELRDSIDPTGSTFGPRTFSDGVIEFRFRVTSQNLQAHSVVLTVRHQDSGSQYIISYHTPDGFTDITYSELNSEWQPMEGISGSAKLIPYSRGEWVKMQVIVNGNQIQAFLNDEPIVTATDSRLPQGNLTLGTGANVTVQFDDFKVTELNSAKSSGNQDSPSSAEAVYKESEVLFSDDFESESLNKWTVEGFWKITQDETGNSVLQREGSQYAEAKMNNSQTWKNYVFESRVKVLQISTASYGETFDLLFRTQGSTRYKWNFNKEFLNFGREPGWTQLQVSSFQLPVNNWFNIRVEMFDNQLRGFVNGEQFFETVDSQPLLGGGAGFSVNANAKIWFDEVKVTELIPSNP